MHRFWNYLNQISLFNTPGSLWVATRLAGKVRVDMLIGSVMRQEEDALTSRLVEHILERIAHGV